MAKKMTGRRVGDDVWSATRAYNPPKHPQGIITRLLSSDRTAIVKYRDGEVVFYSYDDFQDRKDSSAAWILDEHGDWTKDNYMKDGWKIRLPDTSSLR